MTWYHPKYYVALRAEKRKLQASSAKLLKLQAASCKPGSVSPELQAASCKLPDP